MDPVERSRGAPIPEHPDRARPGSGPPKRLTVVGRTVVQGLILAIVYPLSRLAKVTRSSTPSNSGPSLDTGVLDGILAIVPAHRDPLRPKKHAGVSKDA